MYVCVDCNLEFSDSSAALYHLIDHEGDSPEIKQRLNALFDFQMLHYTDALVGLDELVFKEK